jgi:hypothetical protein
MTQGCAPRSATIQSANSPSRRLSAWASPSASEVTSGVDSDTAIDPGGPLQERLTLGRGLAVKGEDIDLRS